MMDYMCLRIFAGTLMFSCVAFEIMAFIGMYRYTPCDTILHHIELHNCLDYRHGFIFMHLDNNQTFAKPITLNHRHCVNGDHVEICYRYESETLVDYNHDYANTALTFIIVGWPMFILSFFGLVMMIALKDLHKTFNYYCIDV